MLFFDILHATASMTDNVLQPDDDTKYIITIRNKSKLVTAKNVVATIGLIGGPVPGIEIVPTEVSFGDIEPGEKSQKVIVILTKRAPECTKHKLSLHLKFEASYRDCECEVVEFEIGKD